MKVQVLIHTAAEGGYWAEVPAFPGCVSEGDTLNETLSSIREAVEGWLEVSNEKKFEVDANSQLVEIEL